MRRASIYIYAKPCLRAFESVYSKWVCGVYSAVIEGLNPDYDLLIEARSRLFTSSNGQSVLCPVMTGRNMKCYIRNISGQRCIEMLKGVRSKVPATGKT